MGAPDLPPPVQRKAILLSAVVVVLLLYGGYATAVSVSNGHEKRVSIVAGIHPDGSMYYSCDQANSTAGVCDENNGHARILVEKRDRVKITVRTDDGKRHSHDFRLEGAPYFLWPAGIEMELEKGTQTKSFTAWATGEYPFVCELKGHKEAGMYGTLVVS